MISEHVSLWLAEREEHRNEALLIIACLALDSLRSILALDIIVGIMGATRLNICVEAHWFASVFPA